MNSNYLNQSYYQNIPSSQVNWAELAQRWIMAKAPTAEPDQASSSNFGFPPLFPPPPLGMRPPFPLPFPPHPMALNAPRLPPPGFFGAPGMPPPPPFLPPGCFPPPNAFQQNTDNEEYKAHYDASLEQDDEPLQEVKDSGAPDGATPHWFNGFDEKGALPVVPSPPDWMMWANMPPPTVQGGPPPNFTPIIDYQMRKKLPAWILEGLEKAEIEKQKKLQKEELKKKQEEEEKAKEARRAEKGRGKFDSDSESDEEGRNGEDNNPPSSSKYNNNNNHSNNSLPIRTRTSSVKEDDNLHSGVELTLEERKKEALLAMRRLMTMVLLEATDGELTHIAKECLARAKRKARPKLLASSDALTALSAFGGDDDDDEDNDETGSRDSESDTERNLPSRKRTHDDLLSKTPRLDEQQRTSAPRLHQNLASFLRPPTPEKNYHSSSNTSSSSSKRSESPSDENGHHSSSRRHTSSSSRRHDSSSSSRHSDSSRHRTSSSSKGHKSSRRSYSPKESKHKSRDSSSPSRHRSSHSSSSSKKKKR